RALGRGARRRASAGDHRRRVRRVRRGPRCTRLPPRAHRAPVSMHAGPGDALRITGSRPLRGTLRLPGEKGMSHRALLFAALADGTSTLEGLAPGDDVRRTAGALHAL